MIDSPFTILFDHRERRGPPYAFDAIRADAGQCPRRPGGTPASDRPLVRVKTRVAHLVTGDYTIEGMESRVAAERKSLADLFGTIGQARRRFVRELERLSAMDAACVVVEAEWSEILASPPVRSQLPPKIVFRSVVAWMVRFPQVQWLMMPGRAAAEIGCYRWLEKVHQQQMRRLPQCVSVEAINK